jgi:heat shock protein HtpX
VHRNWLRAAVVAAASVGLMVFAGAVAAGGAGLVIAVAAIAGVAWAASSLSSRVALSAMRARPVSEVEYPQLYRAVREVSKSARLPVPRVYVSPARQPNSFVTGRSRRSAAVCCTEGLLRALPPDELRGVLGHELAHVREGDIVATSWSAGLAAVITSLVSLAWFRPPGGSGGEDGGRSRGPGNGRGLGSGGRLGSGRGPGAGREPGAGLTMLLLGPVAALLLQLSVSREREYRADALGARLAGDPLPLARALRKIEAGTVEMPLLPTGPLASASHLMIVNPFTGEGFARLFSTHPPTAERVYRLEALAGYPR